MPKQVQLVSLDALLEQDKDKRVAQKARRVEAQAD